MPHPSRRPSTVVLLVSVLAAALVAPARATPQGSPLILISTDPYTDAQLAMDGPAGTPPVLTTR
ncbi:hypothetical protein [Actinophytocola algeriensis]|uniref:Uncharacterized protein n=1 Tax=Actinophytocola algeriensis TaxID=1768010 RepID=A0A7W7Q357_9PSEU|nr:hypothetical protein [Actinophytocola algeriensis]MBB4906175.1 hypothetical protein [Actinophytocola algeriensis]MBE1472140.1 hypothetical protein [Actinophytocola algeriensis]